MFALQSFFYMSAHATVKTHIHTHTRVRARVVCRSIRAGPRCGAVGREAIHSAVAMSLEVNDEILAQHHPSLCWDGAEDHIQAFTVHLH